MPYLNLDLNYFNHPKTRRLVGLLGRGSEVLPLKLWSYCGDFHSKDGRLAGYSPQAIEDIIGWWGKSGEAVSVLLKLVFLEEVPDGFQVHDWIDHQGHIHALKERASAAAKKRWEKYRSECSSIANGTAKALLDVSSKPNHTNPTLTEASEHLTVEQLIPARANGAKPQCSTVHCFFSEGWMPEKEKEFIQLMAEIGPGMDNYGGLWRNRWRKEKPKCLRVLGALREESRQRPIINPGGWMNDQWEKRMS